jgi:hypothetical protein
VQLLRIPSRAQMDEYLSDRRRLELTAVRDRAIASTEVVMSESLIEP